MKTRSDFDSFIYDNWIDGLRWIQLFSLFYLFIGTYSRRPISFRGAPTGTQNGAADQEQEQRLPNTCSAHEHYLLCSVIRSFLDRIGW